VSVPRPPAVWVVVETVSCRRLHHSFSVVAQRSDRGRHEPDHRLGHPKGQPSRKDEASSCDFHQGQQPTARAAPKAECKAATDV
jgi:hypothetical protein